MKQVKFDIELAKKIQEGEIKGTMRTVKGDTVRFLGEINDPVYPLVFAKKIEHSSAEEALVTCTLTGKYNVAFGKHINDIILEIEEEIKEERQKSKHQFKPFDKVLVRHDKEDKWEAAYFSHIELNIHVSKRCYIANNMCWEQCIPYEGNEHLLGTNNKPKED